MIDTPSAFRPTIGLEIHARLTTRTKAFCRCEVSFGAPPNSHTCPICLAWPGTLPVLNAEAVRLAVRSALALRAKISTTSHFDRKNYFYPDLPKGYQITQADTPLARDGSLSIHSPERGEVQVRIERVHMEEDAGRSVHSSDDTSRIDLNRAGAPLVEIVTAPDLRSAEEAISCFSRIRQMLRWVGSCDGNMEEGSIRCDANISLSPDARLGTRVEIKNLNSFRFLGKAIEFEMERQSMVLQSGGTVVQETRLFDVPSGETRSMRTKEDARDYRYFREPDLGPLVLESELIESETGSLMEMPDLRAARYRRDLGLDVLESEALAATQELSELFERLTDRVGDSRPALNWVRNDVLRAMKATASEEARPLISVEQLSDLVDLTAGGTISSTVAREVFDAVWGTEMSPREYVARHGMAQMSDTATLQAIVDRLVDDHPEEAAGYRAGRTRLLGFFVGLVMKETNGKADPRASSELVRRTLEREP